VADEDEDVYVVAEIVDQLRRHGALNDPRALAQRATIPLEDYVHTEVQRSIDVLRTRHDPQENERLAKMRFSF
jgi:hypothetical protein